MKTNKNLMMMAILMTFLFVSSFSFAQEKMEAKPKEDKSKRPSPPAKVTEKVGTTTVTIDYSRPSVKGRKIFGGLEPYDKVWRAGANEATTFEFDKDVKINGQALAKGKYAFFAIPNEGEWTLIFDKKADQWGAYDYKEGNDALRLKVKPVKSPKLTELLTYTIDKKGDVKLWWENVEVPFKIQ